jgi:hypothetical protein
MIDYVKADYHPMAEDLSKLKEIIRTNIRNIKEVADTLVHVREKMLATQETVDEILNRLDRLEAGGANTIDGVRVFSVGNSENGETSSRTPDLDVEQTELGTLMTQHPRWLRPFSVLAELEKHDLEVETLRLKRSSTGYLRVIKLVDGSEWAYFEQMSYERFTRMPLLREVFEIKNGGPESAAEWSTAFVDEPVRLQALQKGARWELLGKGSITTES